MFDADIFVTRIGMAERYLSIIDSDLHHSWQELRQNALICRDLPAALALVHPQHWEGQTTPDRMLGPRAFRTPTLNGTRYCAAADYWGIQCPTRGNRNVAIVADHAWPYSLGGPTHVANIRWLCRRHNAVKSSDVHLYPWEGLWPDWLNELLGKVDRIRTSHR